MKTFRNLTLPLITVALLVLNGCNKEELSPVAENNYYDGGNPIETYNCETAFAKGGYVFTSHKKSNPEKLPSLNLKSNRWGWAINLEEEGTTYYKIYAGAGKNDISKGTIVAYLRIIRTGCEVKVLYAIKNGYTLTEAHIYADDLKPTTTAPGQFGNTFSFEGFKNLFETTINACDTNGDGIWVIAHAVICEYNDL